MDFYNAQKINHYLEKLSHVKFLTSKNYLELYIAESYLIKKKIIVFHSTKVLFKKY